MTLEFKDLKLGDEYNYVDIFNNPRCDPVRVRFLASHPHDGAYLIVEQVDGDGDVMFGCVREELTVIA